jgi:hypothetical protein
MAINHTEMAHELADGLDLRDPLSIVALLADAQVKAAGDAMRGSGSEAHDGTA